MAGMLTQAKAANQPPMAQTMEAAQTPPPAMPPEAMPAGPSPTGDHDMNRPMSPREAARTARLAMQPGAGAATGGDVAATPEEQVEYDRASDLLAKALYEGDTAKSVTKMLTPNEKVGSVAKASLFLVKTLDDKHDFDDVILPQLSQETTDRVIELYEAQTGDEFQEPESQAAFGSVWEGLLDVYGVDAGQYAELTDGMDSATVDQYEDEYNQMLRGASNG